MLRFYVFALLGLLSLAAACTNETSAVTPTDAADQPPPIALSGTELRGLLDNMTLRREGGGWIWHALFLADGTMRGRAEWPGGGASAVGNWDVSEDGLFCREWENNWGGGGRGCFRFYRDGETLVQIYQHGSVGRYRRSRVKMLAGNPAGL